MLGITNRTTETTLPQGTLGVSETREGKATETPVSDVFIADTPLSRIAAGVAVLAISVLAFVGSTIALHWLAWKLSGLSIFDLMRCF